MAPGDQITRDGQIEWRGLLLGVGTVYARQSLSGWLDLPGLADASTAYPAQHGAAPGAMLAQPRIVETELQLAAPGDHAAVEALLKATALRQDEEPLVVQAHGRRLLAYARVIRRQVPMDRLFAVGIGTAAIQWSCSDPRRYAVDEETAVTGLPVAEAGLDWPLDWPLDWGDPGSTGTVTATNEGTAPVSPVISFTGPVSMPSLTRLADGERLEYDVTLAAGEVLTVDCRRGTVLLDGADRLYTATARSMPEVAFGLEPGTTDLAYRAAPGSSDSASTAAVRWRSAWW